LNLWVFLRHDLERFLELFLFSLSPLLLCLRCLWRKLVTNDRPSDKATPYTIASSFVLRLPSLVWASTKRSRGHLEHIKCIIGTICIMILFFLNCLQVFHHGRINDWALHLSLIGDCFFL
jgi:hypothetical protein